MRKPNYISLTTLAVFAALAGPSSADPLPDTLEKALAGPSANDVGKWSFRKTSEINAMDKKVVRATTRWDLSRPAGQQCTVVSVEVLKGDKQETGDGDACKDDEKWGSYAELRGMLADAHIHAVTEDAESATFEITPADPEGGFRMAGVHVNMGDDEVKNLVGTVHVLKPKESPWYIDRVAFRLPEPAGNLLAKVGKLEIEFSYSPDEATGVRLMSSMHLDMKISLFTAFDITTTITSRYDEYQRVQ